MEFNTQNEDWIKYTYNFRLSFSIHHVNKIYIDNKRKFCKEMQHFYKIK